MMTLTKAELADLLFEKVGFNKREAKDMVESFFEEVRTALERGEGVKLLPEDRWKNYTLPPQLLPRSPGHMLDWVRACKGGEMSVSDFSISVPYVEWVLLGVIAFRVPGKLMWDSKTMRFTNNEEANKLLKPIFRKGWELKL